MGDVKMSKQTKEIRSKKRHRIVETATELFTRYGFRRVTIEEICRSAGASKMTFYKYFRNKMDLLRSIWDGWLDDGYRRLDEIDAMEIPFREKLERIVEFKMEMLVAMSPAFIDEIIQAGKPVDMMMYPKRKHGISDRPARIHLYKKMLEFWKMHL